MSSPQLVPQPEAPVSDQRPEYTFTPKEAMFFSSQMEQINRMTAAINNATNLICAQNDLQGRYAIKQDFSGLVPIDGA